MAAHDPSRVLFLGAATYDTIAVVESMPDADSRIEARSLVNAGGGPAATAAVAAARQGLTVDFAGVVGDDEAGEAVVAGLHSEGVGTRHMERRAGTATAQSVVIVSALTAHRAIITRRAPVPETQLPVGYDWVHVDQTGYPALLRLGAPAQTRVSLDDGNPVADLDLGLVDLYVPTVEVLVARFAPSTGQPHPSGTDDLTAGAAHAASAAGSVQVVATDGARGSVFLDGDRLVRVVGLEISPLSTLGAGDVYHGALLAALCLGYDRRGAVEYATVCAGLSTRALDGRTGIPDRSEVEAALPAYLDQAADMRSGGPMGATS